MPRQILRIIDANCNRISEGLRFLEDIARFLLNDFALSKQLKTMRHNLVTTLSQFDTELISERDAETDVGISAGIDHNQDICSLVTANARRVEEALRVVEELSKLSTLKTALKSKDFESARFNLYTLQKELISRLKRGQKIKQIGGLYVIIDTQTIGALNAKEAARKAIAGGAKVIQLRDKQRSQAEILDTAKKLADLCRKSNVLFIVNDYIDIALASNADGVHVGQDDLPLSVIRGQIPVNMIIGLSTSTPAEARKAEKEGADYVAVSAVFPSPTKPEAKVLGLERLHQIKKAVSIPVVAIGGINRQNIGEVISAGADTAAVISAVLNEKDIRSAARCLVKEIEKQAKGHQKS